ncbi:uncharacterized protein BX664DRAFT_289050 [Halteromyces radiatus]|uniref:uncharacterized protein n=1 Tax=Halteromyces radiatus TaxID=101107 RepID=UPI00221F11DC|nr:uncharacterized protein BX664DRAFT_289050 [Halteromyces radiatus]KAI8099116.1 hypothetical protein BX664DRAFT_289050 [Halteromyces radiatus]
MSSPDISFEHFDPQFELGNLDVNGKPIRPRKKPGRKPNPPSPAQRKAQNRAAQRAFRERKRREMREAESTVKHCLHLRDKAIGQVRRLKTKVEELRYENNYLKGQLLTFKLTCIANRVDVPKLWDLGSVDDTGADTIALSKTKDMPQPMEIFLDKHRNIINLSQRHVSSPVSQTPDSFVCSPPSTMLALIAPQLANHLDSPFFQQLLNTDLVSGLISSTTPPMSSPSPATTTTTATTTSSSVSNTDNITSSTKVEVNHCQLKSAPPMNPVEALQYIRMVKSLDNDTRALFKPTELQRMIPHDTRIDYIPGPMMRDLMILYQDYYNANELFDLLVESSTFLGGEVGNPDCWFAPPAFLHKYWFLCPSHRPQRMDNLVDIAVGMGQEMIKMMMERKAMYFERERYADYFPSDLPSTENKNTHQKTDEVQQEQSMNLDTFPEDDFSIDAVMSMVNDLPRLTAAPSDLFAI